MFNCDTDVRKFHRDEVTLSDAQQSEMRDRRNANRDRLKRGLKKNNNPTSDSHQAQGSYAMHTMVQDKDNDYDIDDGVVFLKQDLVGGQGADKTALDARKMICAALDDESFATPPEVLKNCVRVVYQKGYHVDVPVYRKMDDGSLELASSDWKESAPGKVTDWYKNAVCDKSPDSTDGRQLRRITRYIKAYKNSRSSWKSKMASGFAISALVVECYISDDRDDVSLHKTIKAIRNRLDQDLEISHPVIQGEKLTKGSDDAQTKFLRDKLSDALDKLNILFDIDCTLLQALKAWKAVFNHPFWGERVDKEESRGRSFNSTLPINPKVAATRPWLKDEVLSNSSNSHVNFSPNAKGNAHALGLTAYKAPSLFNLRSLEKINQFFPDLRIVDGEIKGQIAFSSKYVQNKHKKWMIESCNSYNDSECVKGRYQIRIAASPMGVFEVFETEGKILKLAKKLNISNHDLHLHNDGSCCLDFILAIDPKLDIKDFILNKVYPYFVWQAYFEKFRSVPPSGEYSHGDKALVEFINYVKAMNRNDYCFCGSGKKSKRCCNGMMPPWTSRNLK